jgi:IS1 family transposase
MNQTEAGFAHLRFGKGISVSHETIDAQELLPGFDGINIAVLKEQAIQHRDDSEFVAGRVDSPHLRVANESVNLAVIWNFRQVGLFSVGIRLIPTVNQMEAKFGLYDPNGTVSGNLKMAPYAGNPDGSQIRIINPSFHNPRSLRIDSNIRAFLGGKRLNDSSNCYGKGDDSQEYVNDEGPKRVIRVVLFGYAAFLSGWALLSLDVCFFTFFRSHSSLRTVLWGTGLLFMLGGLVSILLLQWRTMERTRQRNKHETQSQSFHSGEIVPRKYLTRNSYWGTVIGMANVLNADKQIAVIGALAEGSSIRSIERITGVHRDTIMRLGVKVGEGCAKMLDTSMRNLPCNRLEMDEIWGFVGKKDRNVREGDNAVGSVWTFCAIDAETKLVPAFKCGDRDTATAKAFVQDVANRMAYRVQISTDGLNAYVAAMESAFGGNVDYAQIIKTYGHEEVSNNRRYSAPEFVSSEKKVVVGNPDPRLISTSYIERLNATTRLHMRRLTRLTLAFSKKRENFEAAIALHFAYYNFVKRHNTLRCTPAMAAGVTGSFWTVGDLLEAIA